MSKCYRFPHKEKVTFSLTGKEEEIHGDKTGTIMLKMYFALFLQEKEAVRRVMIQRFSGVCVSS